MPDLTTYLLFLGAALTVLFIPGPAVLYVLTRSADQGRAAGVVSAIGLGIGNLVQALAVVLGLSAVLAASHLAFEVLKFAGAAYLISLGIRRVLSKSPDASVAAVSWSRRKLFTQGIIINILNPKSAVFLLAFLPTFVDPSAGAVRLQLAIFGLSYAFFGILTDSLYALTVGAVLSRIRGHRRSMDKIGRASGFVYIGLGVAGALTSQPRR